ncbi:MAG: glycosyltransferase family 9 protein [Chitinophagaceae bacterium]|nr:MAG: glycosyltransferase family 9 protein [Chitinophagaceae bacterium]
MKQIGHIIVLRFSAMGDVATVVPVVKALLQQHPSLRITLVSNGFFAPLFAGIERCDFFAVATKSQHKGVGGLFKLFQQLKKDKQHFAVADLHNVLRTKLVKFFFTLSGARVASIDKGRADKKKLTAHNNKVLRQLPTSHARYAKVFAALGFPVNLKDHIKLAANPLPERVASSVAPGKMLVGVAPFAQHAPKMYPLEKMKTFLQQLQATQPVQLLFFGAPGNEAATLQQWQQEFAGSINIAGAISFAEELQVISNLKMMISMDSANMHLASMYNVPVLSIWGATHPFAGFYGFNQPDENIAQVSLYCRPCSVFGNKPCHRGDHACMHLISTEMLLQKAAAILQR